MLDDPNKTIVLLTTNNAIKLSGLDSAVVKSRAENEVGVLVKSHQ